MVASGAMVDDNLEATIEKVITKTKSALKKKMENI